MTSHEHAAATVELALAEVKVEVRTILRRHGLPTDDAYLRDFLRLAAMDVEA